MTWARTSEDVKRHRTQKDKVLAHLQSGKPIDQDAAQALYGVRRLASRITELTKGGHVILTLRNKSQCAVYVWLAGPEGGVQDD